MKDKRMDTEQARATVRQIRELIKTHGVTKTAKIVGRSKSNVSRINRGQRLQDRFLVAHLKIEHGTGKLCRKCGNEAILIAGESRLCIACELIALSHRGIVYIAPAFLTENPHTTTPDAEDLRNGDER